MIVPRGGWSCFHYGTSRGADSTKMSTMPTDFHAAGFRSGGAPESCRPAKVCRHDALRDDQRATKHEFPTPSRVLEGGWMESFDELKEAFASL